MNIKIMNLKMRIIFNKLITNQIIDLKKLKKNIKKRKKMKKNHHHMRKNIKIIQKKILIKEM